MILNYFKVAWRALSRSKGYSFINIMGLSIGLASVILIFIYIQDELTYDTAHPASSQTFGIGVEITNEQGEKRFHTTVPAGLAHLLKEQMPDQVAHILRYYQMVWSYSMRNPEEDEVILSEDGEIFFVEESYPKVMYFPLIQGNRNEALTQPNSVVLSETAAQRLFGEVDVLGRQVEMQHRIITDGYISLEVTGVMEDYPGNIHMQPDYLISMGTLNPFLQRRMEVSTADVLSSMDKLFMATYIRVTDDADLEQVETAVKRIAEENFREANFKINPFLRKITDFHFDDQVDWSWWNSQADYSYIVIFGSIGLMILLIACINYMNLATAKSARRAREIGVRKALGSSRWSLIFQFFQESLLTSFIALLIALLLVVLALPTYNQLADKQFTLFSLVQIDVIGALLIIWLIVAIVSSAYPAIFLSGFKTVEVLKGKLVLRKGSSSLRKGLVVAQFAVSVLLIISTGIILQQMNLVENTKLYDNAESIMSIAIGPGIAPTERFEVLKNELLNNGDVEEITLAVGLPRLPHIHPLSASLTLPELNDQVYNWKRLGGDYNFPKMFNLKLVVGRSFDEQNVSDSSNYLINETAVRMLNITPDEVIGYTVLDTISQESGRVIGVVEDFHFESIHTSIKPTVIQGKPQQSLGVHVKIPSDKIPEKLAAIEKTWKEVMSGAAFKYQFMNDKLENMYASEIRIAGLIRVFSILAVLIACLGLYGLASYTAEQKTKEIGVRKVLGATVPQILLMLIGKFMLMVLIACVIALPLGYFLMQGWLQNFVYQAEIGWTIFGISVLIIVVIALATVAYESIKASTINPTKAIRHE